MFVLSTTSSYYSSLETEIAPGEIVTIGEVGSEGVETRDERPAIACNAVNRRVNVGGAAGPAGGWVDA